MLLRLALNPHVTSGRRHASTPPSPEKSRRVSVPLQICAAICVYFSYPSTQQPHLPRVVDLDWMIESESDWASSRERGNQGIGTLVSRLEETCDRIRLGTGRSCSYSPTPRRGQYDPQLLLRAVGGSSATARK